MLGTGQVALFIDAENVSHDYADDLIAFCRMKGRLTIARCYGNEKKLKEWDAASRAHHLVAVPTASWAAKTNASDFALVIDAVKLALANDFEWAVIASSDHDFTQLAIFLRERGAKTILAGEENKTLNLRRAFSSFYGLRVLAPNQPAASVQACKNAEDILDQVFDALKNDRGEVPGPLFGTELKKRDPDFKPGGGHLRKRLIDSGRYAFHDNIIRRQATEAHFVKTPQRRDFGLRKPSDRETAVST